MGIIRGVSGQVLDCGCLMGVYETYAGELVRVIDAVGDGCDRHRKGETVPDTTVPPADTPGTKR